MSKKSILKKSLISGIILIIAAVAVAVAATTGVIPGQVANIILPVLVAGTVAYNAYNVIFLGTQVLQNQDKNDSDKK